MTTKRQEFRAIEDRVKIATGNFPAPDAPYVAMLATSRDDLILMLEAIKEDNPEHLMAISMPCGRSRVFEKIEDIPFENAMCPCGNPEHYLIKFVRKQCPECKGTKRVELQGGLINKPCPKCKGTGEVNDNSIDITTEIRSDSGDKPAPQTVGVAPARKYKKRKQSKARQKVSE